MASTNLFKDVPLVPTDHVFHVMACYNKDKDPSKINLGVGAYRDNDGKPWVLPVVSKVETQLAQGIADGTLNHEYLGIDGLRQFSDIACKLLLGGDHPAIAQNRVCGIQSISGTGSVFLGLKFLYQFYNCKTAYISKPTWGNHLKTLKAVGFTDIREYRYYKAETCSVDFDAMWEDLEKAPEGSIIVLHECAHNPTGVDLSHDQWVKIADIMKKRQLFPYFDTAYQGFASGDVDEDAWAVRYFASQGFELIAAQSFAKNFGLYNERAGNVCVVTSDDDCAERIRSQMKALIRPMWSNPPNHGARIVATILCNDTLQAEWRECVHTMGQRMLQMRQALFSKLKELGTPGTWNHVIDQRGMFSFTGLNLKQVRRLTEKHHIYLLDSGRINICGLTPANVEYVARAIHDVVTHKDEV
ncbi:aspartate aminotransferase, cytoplasmic [Nematostella vectensis]|uniref:aspartate aminotransferase, cytoplasmic n=1 Tax=Nematostella vectensis TaxID=45351 RepID=UPI0020772B5F|nr:aspartate aminotransferase, cytoplasmic [Nematostella vectensis]